MAIEREILDRLSALEYEAKDCHRNLAATREELREAMAEIADLKVWRVYCDKMALRWGGFLMGALTLGTIIAMGFDKVKEKIVSWFLS